MTMNYAGIDIGMRETAICVINEDGDIVDEFRSPTDPDSIIQYFEQTPFEISGVIMEACNMARWLYLALEDAGYDCVCVETYHSSMVMKAMQRNKTDKNDAWGLAQLLRNNIYKAVHVKSAENQALLHLLTTRKSLVRQRVDLENVIRGHFRQIGLRITGSEAVFIRNVEEALEKRPELEESVGPLLTLLKTLTQTFRDVRNKCRRIAARDPVCKLLMTIPGVGPVASLTFKAVIDDPTRFRKSKDVAPYLGLTPRIHASGETKRYGSISKSGSPIAREALYEASTVLLSRTRKWCALKYWGVQIAKRSCHKKARVAVARKLAILMHKLWVTNETYCYKLNAPEMS